MSNRKYKTEEQFLYDLNNNNTENLWDNMIKYVAKWYKEDGLAWLTLIDCIKKYDIDRLPTQKDHRWQFAAYFKQKMRKAMQNERMLLNYPIKVSTGSIAKTDITAVDIYDNTTLSVKPNINIF